MAEPNPRIIALWIANESQDVSFLPLRDAMVKALRRHLPSYSDEQITDLAELREPAVTSQLDLILQDRLSRGIDPTFALEGEPRSLYVRSVNTRALADLVHLQKLPPDDFEQFCVDILSALGASARRTGGPDDAGVDFIATGLPISSLGAPSLLAPSPVVIGQAKRYASDNLVSLQETRAFLGAAILKWDEIRRGSAQSFGLLAPVTYAFWTSSDFSETGLAFTRGIGIWALGGVALAQLARRLSLPVTSAWV